MSQAKVLSYQQRLEKTKISLAFTLTALIFSIPANLFPFMTMQIQGSKNTATIWSGIKDLASQGSWFIAVIIFIASLAIPIVKLIILLYLNLTIQSPDRSELKFKLYEIVEAIGKWSMLDVFLMAILIVLFKFGKLTYVKAEVGSYMFTLVVISTMIASIFFDETLIKDRLGKK